MISIRKSILSDCDRIWQWENDPSIWSITDEPGPFEKEDILSFLNLQNDLEQNGQERWLMFLDHEPIGMIDLFQYNSDQRSVGIGLVIMNQECKGKGYGKEVMYLMENHLISVFRLEKFSALVFESNQTAIGFFRSIGYVIIGMRNHRGKSAIELEKIIK
jgi:diamine N-acetyltransferase